MSSPRYRKSNVRKKVLDRGGSSEGSRSLFGRNSSFPTSQDKLEGLAPSLSRVGSGTPYRGCFSEGAQSPFSGTSSFSMVGTAERTVRRLRLSKTLTIPETTTVLDACRRMAYRRIDALLLTDSNALLCGIMTDKDIATRAIACRSNLQETLVSKVMTRNPVFVLSNTLAVDAVQKMIQGNFRHVPVVENGEVIALLELAKCLSAAIACMERAAEKGKAIFAAVEASNNFTETLRDSIFRPSLSTVISEHSKLTTVSPVDSVVTAAQKMNDSELGCAIVTVKNKPIGILTCKDILMRVIAADLPPESTPVQKVMTPNPECATLGTSILDALLTMHDGKFLHLPIVDADGCVVAIADIINVTQAAMSITGPEGANNEAACSMMQRFLESSMQFGITEDDEGGRHEEFLKHTFEGNDAERSLHALHQPHSFDFKIEDRRGIMHRFVCDTRSLNDLVTCILQRVGEYIDRRNLPQILYEDEDHDKVLLASDMDLAVAVDHARAAGWKGLRLHLDYSSSRGRRAPPGSGMQGYAESEFQASTYGAVAAGAALFASLGMVAFYMRRTG